MPTQWFPDTIATLAITATLALAGPAVSGPVHDAARTGDTVALTELLDGGADVNELAIMTPLQMAALNGQLEAVKVLIQHGADLNAESSIIGTALHAAAQRGHAEVINAILESGANTEARDSRDLTPLMSASVNGHAAAVDALVAGGADPNAVGLARGNASGGYGRVNALHLALLKGHKDIGTKLRQAGAVQKSTEDAAKMLAKGDAARGNEFAVARCGHCHKIMSEDEVVLADGRGLSLIGVIGRKIGAVEGFEYSDSLKETEGVWTAELLYTFATDAMLTIPGTRMNWHDGWTDDEAADIVAYFASVAE